MTHTATLTTDPQKLERLQERFEHVLGRLEQASNFAKATKITDVLDQSKRLLKLPEGALYLAEIAHRFQPAGVFYDSDWHHPERLQPQLIPSTLKFGEDRMVTVECLSLLRWLAIAENRHSHPGISSEHATHFLREALAVNLDFVFDRGTELSRERRTAGARQLFALLAERIGYDSMLEQLVEEAWRILRQRPVKVDGVKAMITKLAVYLADPETPVSGLRGADRLISALFGPSQATHYDPGLEHYEQALVNMDAQTLRQEATAFARAMTDTGLVSVYHATLVQWLLKNEPDLISSALGLSTTGSDTLMTYRELIHELIRQAVHPETCQCIYGLACLLERGILFTPPMAPSLWRQVRLKLRPEIEQQIISVYGNGIPPKTHLLGGLLNVLGQPFGVGQGHNPTCQSARAIAMWAYNDADYLMQLVTWAARDGDVTMHFEGQELRSSKLRSGMASELHLDLDPVSLVLVPHLDRIYLGMGKLIGDRGEDPHKWINPEFHGWWVGRGFAIAVDVENGQLDNYEDFVREFYASYHPYYNGNQPQIHPQPAGIAVTDSGGDFVGWHAITIVRVSLDQQGEMRAYFYNPNNDGGQDWGCGVVVSTEGNGEYFGENSLPVAQLASRLYIFHFDTLEHGEKDKVPDEEIEHVRGMAIESWASDRIPVPSDPFATGTPR